MTRQQIHRRLDGASVRAHQHHRVQVKLVDQPLLLLSLLDTGLGQHSIPIPLIYMEFHIKRRQFPSAAPGNLMFLQRKHEFAALFIGQGFAMSN